MTLCYIFGILFFWIVPSSIREGFVNRYKKYIDTEQSDELDVESDVKITLEDITIISKESKVLLKISIIKKLIEFSDLFIIMIKGSKGIIINKSINDDSLGTELKDWSASLGIEYKNELDWKWK
jgi:hypothetical protein